VWFFWILVIGLCARLANSLLNRATLYFSPEPVGNEEFEKYQFPGQSGYSQGSGNPSAETVENNTEKE